MKKLNDTRIRWAFWSKSQMPFFMIWREYYYENSPQISENVEYAAVIFNSMDWIGF